MTTMNDQVQCRLCDFEFPQSNAVCHHGCQLGRFCKLIKCPSCQYEFPEPSHPLAWLAKMIHAGKKPLPSVRHCHLRLPSASLRRQCADQLHPRVAP